MSSHTKDDNKKARDNQARNEEKNIQREKNKQAGKDIDSKKMDHL